MLKGIILFNGLLQRFSKENNNIGGEVPLYNRSAPNPAIVTNFPHNRRFYKMAPKKKDFSSVNVNPVYDAIAEATAEQGNGTIEQETPAQDAQEIAKKQYKPRKTYNAEETLAALESLQTSGKKGVKLPRINLAFTPANYEFIKTMAQVRGQNLTEFVNDMLTEARTSHADIYEKAIEFRNSL